MATIVANVMQTLVTRVTMKRIRRLHELHEKHENLWWILLCLLATLGLLVFAGRVMGV